MNGFTMLATALSSDAADPRAACVAGLTGVAEASATSFSSDDRPSLPHNPLSNIADPRAACVAGLAGATEASASAFASNVSGRRLGGGSVVHWVRHG